LDAALRPALPEGTLEQFARARSQYGLLQSIQRGAALKPDGTFNLNSLKNAVRSNVGEGKWHQGVTKDMQPELAHLTEVLKFATNPRMLPAVSNSGTADRLMAAEMGDVAMAALRGDVGSAAQMAKEGMGAKVYEHLAETNPRALAALLASDPVAAQAFGGAAGRNVAGEVSE